MIKRFSRDRMLHEIGGWYLTLLIAVAQVIALFGAIPGILSIRANAELEAQQLRTFSILLPISIIVTVSILVAFSRSLIFRMARDHQLELALWASRHSCNRCR